MTNWGLRLLVGIVFTGFGLLVGLLAWTDDFVPGWFVAAGIGGIGILLLSTSIRSRRRVRRGANGAFTASPGEGTWTFAQIGEEIARTFSEDPVVVRASPELITVIVDLADPRFLEIAAQRDTQRLIGVDVALEGPGTASIQPWHQRVEIVDGVARVTDREKKFIGTVVSVHKRVVLGAGPNGERTTEEERSDTGVLSRPITQVLQDAGWSRDRISSKSTRSQSTLGKGPIVVGIIGASAVVVVPLAFLTQGLMAG